MSSDTPDFNVNGLGSEATGPTSGIVLLANGEVSLSNVDVTPLHDMLFVRQIDDKITPAGLHIPDSASFHAKHGVVVFASKGARAKDGNFYPLMIKEGDHIMYVGDPIPIKVNSEMLYIVRENEAFCIISQQKQ